MAATLDPSQALAHLPSGLRDELLNEFAKITQNYRELRWEAAELDGGRFCEIAYTILAGHLDGDQYPTHAIKPNGFKTACERLESKTAYPKSARLTLPRVLVALYDIRNQRGVGHVGGDVDANHMDATYVLHSTQWVMAELVRIFHGTNIEEATAIVDALVERTIPLIWRIGNVTRVLNPNMSLADQTLLLLYAAPKGLTSEQLGTNLEQKRMSNYMRVLWTLHDKRMIEYTPETKVAIISPTGIAEVEERILH